MQKQIEMKTEELYNSVYNFSNNIPGSDLLNIGGKLVYSMGYVSKQICSNQENIDNSMKTKFYVAVLQSLAECKSYLKLIQTLKYGETNELVSKLDDLSNLICNEKPINNKTLNLIYQD